MIIETIRVKNFKALRDVEICDLPAYCVFVGRNGTGKTTLFRVFAFLKNCLARNVRVALTAEGGRNGLREVLTRGHEGEDLEIEIQFRLEIAGTERLVTYRLEIGEDATKGVIVNAVTPATFESPILDNVPQSHIDYMRSKIPMERFGTADENAAAVCFLASEECSFTTASTLDTSGGRTTY